MRVPVLCCAACTTAAGSPPEWARRWLAYRDEYTLPSRLQAHLERRYPALCLKVSNYGQGYFFSSQELLPHRVGKVGNVPL